MTAYVRRWIGYLTLSLALALAIGPFSGQMNVEETGPRLYLTSVAITKSNGQQPDLTSWCDKKPFNILEQDLIGFPALNQALAKLTNSPFEDGGIYVKEDGIKEFTRNVTGGIPRSFCLARQGWIYLVERSFMARRATVYLIGLPLSATASLPQAPSGGLRQALQNYQHSRSVAAPEPENLPREADDNGLEPIQTDIPPLDWLAAVKVEDDRPAALVADDRVYLGRVMDIPHTLKTPIPAFAPVRYGLAFIFLVLGLWVMRGSIRKNPGFRVSPGWAARFGDAMFILLGAVGAFGALEYGLIEWVGAVPGLADDLESEGLRVVSAAMWVPVTLVCAMFTANLATQSLEVTQKGITGYGPGKPNFAAWGDIMGLDLSSDYVAVGRVGLLIPRKLQTRLVIETKGDSLTLFEPANKLTKHGILNAIKEHGPSRLAPDLERIRNDW